MESDGFEFLRDDIYKDLISPPPSTPSRHWTPAPPPRWTPSPSVPYQQLPSNTNDAGPSESNPATIDPQLLQPSSDNAPKDAMDVDKEDGHDKDVSYEKQDPKKGKVQRRVRRTRDGKGKQRKVAEAEVESEEEEEDRPVPLPPSKKKSEKRKRSETLTSQKADEEGKREDIPEVTSDTDKDDRVVTPPPNQLQSALQAQFESFFHVPTLVEERKAEAMTLFKPKHVTVSGLASEEGSHFLGALMSFTETERRTLSRISQEKLALVLRPLLKSKGRDNEDGDHMKSPEHKQTRPNPPESEPGTSSPSTSPSTPLPTQPQDSSSGPLT